MYVVNSLLWVLVFNNGGEVPEYLQDGDGNEKCRVCTSSVPLYEPVITPFGRASAFSVLSRRLTEVTCEVYISQNNILGKYLNLIYTHEWRSKAARDPGYRVDF